MKIDKKAVLSRLTLAEYQRMVPSLKKGAGNTAQGICPFHPDKNPSLTVYLDKGNFVCFGCQERGDAFDLHKKINGTDFKTALETLASWTGVVENGEQRLNITNAYSYTDEAGELLYEVVRLEPKTFKQRRPDGKGVWSWGLGDTRRVLYNLPEVIKAQKVYFVEGEKDADNLNRLGLVATCNAMGAGKWRTEYTDALTGKDVVILPDNDVPGKDHARKVANELQGKVKSIKVVELPGLPVKGDVSDWLEAGHSVGELNELVQNTAELEPATINRRIPLISSVELMAQEAKPIEWIVDGLIPSGNITLLAAPPSCYKTWFAMCLGYCVAEGLPFLGRDTVKSPVVYIDRENPLNVVQDRLAKIGQSENLKLWLLRAEPEPPSLEQGDAYIELAETKPLIIMDSLMRFHNADENDAMQMGRVTKQLRDICMKGATLLVLHHAGKGEDSFYRGSSEILGGVDVGFTIKKGEGRLTLKGIKNRLIVEPNIPVKIIDDGISFGFQDVSGIEREEKEHEREMELESMKEIIAAFDEPPIQTEIIERAKELGFAEKHIREILKAGEGKKWVAKRGGHKNKTRYSLLENKIEFGSSAEPIYSGQTAELKTEEDIPNLTPATEYVHA